MVGSLGPLEHFGPAASALVAEALLGAGIGFHGGGRPFDPESADFVVSVPLVRGPQMDGVPATGLYGLIPVDDHGHVFGLPDAYAVGDATDYPVKQAAIACQQADAAAESVATRCGLDILPAPGLFGQCFGKAFSFLLRLRLRQLQFMDLSLQPRLLFARILMVRL